MPIPSPDPRAVVAVAVRRVLDHEAKENELRVGLVRIGGFGAIGLIDVVTAALGLRPASQIAQTLVATAIASLVYAEIRRSGARPIHSFAIPLLDLVLLGMVLRPRLVNLGPHGGIVISTALVCALFAVTGALRFERRSSIWTTALAAVLLVLLLGGSMPAHDLAYALTALSAVGMLAMWLADLVRRSMEGAASRDLLARFLPRELVDGAFADPLAGFGAPRTVEATVLMSDLRGFTAIAERLPPDRVFAFLSDLQGELARIVQAHGGVVDKFLGDGMLAVFGLTGGRDHADRAIAAARDIRRAVTVLDAANTLGAPVRLGIGIHTGPLVAGCLGTGDRLESTVIGDTVNTASRLEALTKEHDVDVLLTDAVVRRAALPVDAVPLGAAHVRGRAQEVAIYTLP